MGLVHSAATTLGERSTLRAWLLGGLCACACAHVPPLIVARDVLTPAEHLRLGTSYDSQGLRGEAAAQYEAAVRLDPACGECWLALGNTAFTDGRYADAEKSFRKALKAAPHHPGAENNLAMTLMERHGSLPEAESLAQDALLQGGPLRPYIQDTVANIYLRQGRYAEAAAAADLAEAAAPDSLFVRERLLATRDSIKAAVAARGR